MSKSTNLIDGSGNGLFSYVDEGGFLRVQQSSYPPITDEDTQIVYREFLTLNGDGTTSSMIVNGSVTPQRFYIQAEPGFDIYIKNLSFLLAGNNETSLFTNFAGNAALTNGCNLYYEDSNGQIIIGSGLTNNYSLINLCLGNPSFGARFQQAAGNIVSPFFLKSIDGNVAASAEAIIPVLNFSDTFGLPYGLKLTNSTTNKLVFEIRDNLTPSATLTQFNIITYGFKRKVF